MNIFLKVQSALFTWEDLNLSAGSSMDTNVL